MNIITRNPLADETAVLYDIWNCVFGSIGMDSFFRHLYSENFCIVALYDGIPVSAGYLVPFGDLKVESYSIPCSMIYSVATLPEYRGFGLGTAVVNELVSRSDKLGYPAVVLCPSEDNLFEYYCTRTKFRKWFFTDELSFKKDSFYAQPATPIEISPAEYCSKRDVLLNGSAYIKHNSNIYEYQSMLNNESGGGFFIIDDCCAIVERESDKIVYLKELLVPDTTGNYASVKEIARKAVSSISQLFSADEYIVRLPSTFDKGRRFGMLAINESDFPCVFENKTGLNGDAPWYGVAFD